MNKIIICDLDGTLLDAKGQLASETIKKVNEFIDSGGTFIIATGRLDHDIVYIEKKLGVRGSYRISQNGAIIKSQYNELLWKQELESITANEIVSLLNKNNLRVEISDAYYRYFPSPRGAGNVAEFVDHSIVDPDFNKKIGKDIFPTLLLAFGTEEIFQNITNFIDKDYGQEVDTIMTSSSTLEVLSKGVSKGSAIKKILKDQHLKSNRICAIGDSENDVSMFEIADYAYTISTASENIQNEADDVYSTVGDCIDAFIKKN